MRVLRKYWLPLFLIFDLLFAIYAFRLYMTDSFDHESSVFSIIYNKLKATVTTISDVASTEVSKITVNEIKLNAPQIQQKPDLPRGCEVTSLAMMLQYAGIKADKMTLASQIKKVPYQSNGLYGNPNDGFVGDMYRMNQPGYGVYHKPLANLGNRYLSNGIIDLTGQSFESVLDQLRKKIPVVVITNASFKPLPNSSFTTWDTSSGKVKISFHEHAVLVTGFDDENIYFNNPLGKKNASANREAFIKAWEQMGRQAISYQK
ncbi:C39 family peptidase [Terrilactibacillus laevilacticus]|uniref:C39 family peptidase n=1 Tax=Terrilactibacillus laevilacticus TaxID=1380157 RepID=UPI001FE31FBA|nr:C39 family peptidase [Terrilactibacillus laevilacticus]